MKLSKLDASNSGFESDDDIFVGGTPLMAILCILQARSPIEFMMIWYKIGGKWWGELGF